MINERHVDIREIICPTEYGDIIPSDITLSAGVKEFYEKGRESLLKEALSDIGDEYDYIIIDTPPCGILQDASFLASYSDAVLMVIRQDYQPVNRVIAGLELMADTGTRILGYVINNEAMTFGSYGYGRYGYGNYGYGKYGCHKYGKYGGYGYGESGRRTDSPQRRKRMHK